MAFGVLFSALIGIGIIRLDVGVHAHPRPDATTGRPNAMTVCLRFICCKDTF